MSDPSKESEQPTTAKGADKKQEQEQQPTDSAEPPEQKAGDTPVAPWNMPTPEEKAEARPVRQALKEALSEVDSPEKADEVVRELEAATAGQTVADVQQTQPAAAPSTREAAQQVKEACQAAPAGEKTQNVLAETARVLAASEGREREVVAEAAQEVFNPQQQGAPTAATAPQEQEREHLRHAMLRRLKPLDALDANLFLKINHLPHTRLINRFFYFITTIFTAGAAWFGLMGLVTLYNRRFGWRVIRHTALPLAISSSIVEFPIKSYFRRKRPFIAIIQAIVIGKKPGTWSFPSGHSAVAFAGAWLLSQHFQRSRGLLYAIASLVAFSRVYLGDHYPGDVVTGSALGTLFAILIRSLFERRRRKSQ